MWILGRKGLNTKKNTHKTNRLIMKVKVLHSSLVAD